MRNKRNFATRPTHTHKRRFCLATCCRNRRCSQPPRTNTGRRCLRSGQRELTLKRLWGRSSAVIPTNAQTRLRRVATVALSIALGATIVAGCHHESALPAKPPIAVRLADLTLDQSTEGPKYSPSLFPYPQVD